MPNFCKDLCSKYKHISEGRGNTGRYTNGAKRCTTCQIYLVWEGLRCPCCGQQLRTKPRKPEYKKNLLIALTTK